MLADCVGRKFTLEAVPKIPRSGCKAPLWCVFLFGKCVKIAAWR